MLDIVAPSMIEDPRSTRDLIIAILGEHYPLTIRQIHSRIRSEYGLSISYQAVHKLVKDLIQNKILEKKGREYELNLVWINRLEKFVANVKNNYESDSKLSLEGIKSLQRDGQSTAMIFDTLEDAEKYRKKLQQEYIAEPNPKPAYCSHSQHLKSPIVFSERTIKILELIKKTQTNCYLLVNGASILDNWCLGYYSNRYVRIKTGATPIGNSETYVMGDLILQMYIPDSVQQKLDNLYTSVNRVSEVSVPKFYQEVYESKANVRVQVFKNAEIAEQLRNQIISKFTELNRASFFDIDNTLIKGFLMIDFFKYLYSKHAIDKASVSAMQDAVNQYRQNRIPYSKAALIILNLFVKGLKGKSVSDIRASIDEFFNENFQSWFTHTRPLLDAFKQYGMKIVITGTPSILIEPLRKMFGFDLVSASIIGEKDNIFNGELTKNLALQQDKENEIKEIIADHKINLSQCFAFGDTTQDLPMLERVAYPVAVMPEDSLKKIALKNNWQIIENNGDHEVIIGLVKKLSQ